MCLYNLDSSIKDKNFGYKIISKNGKASFFPSKVLPTEKWLNEKDYRQDHYKKEKYLFLESNVYHDKLAYLMGWHVFYTKIEAISYNRYVNKYVIGGTDVKIVKVEIKNIVATGYQCSGNKYRTIVCKYIKIEKEK